MEAQHNAQQETAWQPLSIAVVAPYSFGHAIPAAFFAVRLANAGHSVAFLTSAGLLRNIKALLLQEEAWSANEVEWVALHDGLTAAEVAKARGAYPGYGELPFFMGVGRERMAAALLPHIEQLRDAYDTWVIDAMAFGALGILGKDSATAAHLLTSTTPPFARQYYQDVITECRSARGLLLLSCDAIEEIPQEWRRPQLRLLGPMAPPCSGADISGTTLGQWLDSCAQHKEPVVFVSMGSHIELSEEQVGALAQGLDDARWCVVWAISAAANARLPPALHRRRFFFTPWAPQRQVLAHEAVAAAVLHCGWGGVTEAAAAGVPIVAAPFVGDQPFNAAALQAKGTGVAIANWPRPTASDVKAAVAAVVGNAALAAR
ncbi:CGT [Symbiodinium sp. KB8]|nr:CGT [Symbiodinium sp. KB8]